MSNSRTFTRQSKFDRALEGFISRLITTTPLLDCKSTLKAFVGLALAFLVTREGTESALEHVLDEGFEDHEYIYVFSQNGGEWAWHRSIELDKNISALLRRLQIARRAESDSEEGEKRNIFQFQLQLIETAFRTREGARKIRLAAEWLCDSFANEDDFASFVQATTALEILLGGSKEESARVGLTELLANRLAYLVAKKPSDREDIMQEFRDIYDIRSNIVHNGKTRLNSDEQRMLSSLKAIVGEVLGAELKLLIKEDKLS